MNLPDAPVAAEGFFARHSFDLRKVEQEVGLTITAPEEAREAADFLFEQFVGSVERTSSPIAPRGGASVDEKSHSVKGKNSRQKKQRVPQP